MLPAYFLFINHWPELSHELGLDAREARKVVGNRGPSENRVGRNGFIAKRNEWRTDPAGKYTVSSTFPHLLQLLLKCYLSVKSYLTILFKTVILPKSCSTPRLPSFTFPKTLSPSTALCALLFTQFIVCLLPP